MEPERMNIVITGHMDHGKSTLVGRLLADTQSLPEGKLQAVKDMCKKNGQVFEYAFLLDALDYSEEVFERIKAEYGEYLETLKVRPVAFVPVSAREGKNITSPADETPWYTGRTVLELPDSFHNLPSSEDLFFAMPVQDVYRFSDDNDNRRIYAGAVVSGEITAGDRVTFLPSRKEARIKNIEVWNAPPKTRARASEASGFTLEEEIYVKRGEVMLKAGEKSPVEASDRIQANLIWLGARPMVFNKSYLLKLGSSRTEARLERIESFPGDNAGEYNGLYRHDCGSVILRLAHPIAVSSFYDNPSLGRFVLVDGYDAAGCGIILQSLGIESVLQSLGSFEGAPGNGNFEDEFFALLKKYFPHRFG